MMTEFSEQVESYIKQDRQWPRQLRIAHAKMQMGICLKRNMMFNPEAQAKVNFWQAVLQRNEG
jgi:hypothetical protein